MSFLADIQNSRCIQNVKRWLRSICIMLILLNASAGITHSQTASVDFEPDRRAYSELVAPFLKTHCERCHGTDKQEADFRVDEQLLNKFLDRSVTEKWSEVLNRLNAGDMPPRGERRPPASEVRRVVEWIEHERLRAEKARNDHAVVLRRMNRQEYNNTIRDLMGVRLDLVDDFPEDPPAGGFDNNGRALTISPLHLELYLKSAQKILDRAIVDPSRPPQTIKWHFEVEDGMPGSDRRRVHLDDQLNRNIRLECGPRPAQDGMIKLRFHGEAARVQYFYPPLPGEYVIRIRAAGVTPSEEVIRREGPVVDIRHRQQDWHKNNLDAAERQKRQESYDKWSAPGVRQHYETDRTYRYGPPRVRIVGYFESQRPVLDAYDVMAPVDAPETYESRVLLTTEKSSLEFTNPYRVPYAPHYNPHYIVQRDDFPRPELLMDWIEIEGPVYDDWPPSSHQRIFIDSPNKGRDESAYARDVLSAFMRRAWRRPLRDGELEPQVALFQQVRSSKTSFEEAIKVPLLTVLASPHFLYLVEPESSSNDTGQQVDHDSRRRLSDHEVASRLSYFLWSSTPDDELLRLAASSELSDQSTRLAQVDRMLADPRSATLVSNFAGQWLELRKIGSNPPDVPRYDEHLEASMRGETEAFFEHILRNDRSVLEFLSSDYITINERLARFYDIPGVKGDHFRPVPVSSDRHRGGLLGQASILSITSNGTRTSPVWRGVWVLNNLLGSPPPPPPPNAGDIPPVEQNNQPVTLRQRLQLHREQPQCARCHNRIDPLGFALENFDHSGGWRDQEGTRRDSPVIDASAQLPDGTQFEGVDGLRRELMNRQDQFLHCLAGKLYTYALGREPGYADEPVIADAVATMKSHDLTLRSLIRHIVTSDAFLSKQQ